MRIVLVALAAAAVLAVLAVLCFTRRERFSPQDIKDLAARVSAMRSGKADEGEEGADVNGDADDNEDGSLDPTRNEVKRDPEEPEEIDEKYGSIALALMTSKRDGFDRLLAHYDSADAFNVDKLEADMMPSCSSGQSVSLENSSPGSSGAPATAGTP